MKDLSFHPATLWRVKQVQQVYPVSRSKIISDSENGLFPKPIRLGPRSIAWRAVEVVEYIEALGVDHV